MHVPTQNLGVETVAPQIPSFQSSGLILALLFAVLTPWFLTRQPIVLINTRLRNIESDVDSHFGEHKALFNERWKRRIRELENAVSEIDAWQQFYLDPNKSKQRTDADRPDTTKTK